MKARAARPLSVCVLVDELIVGNHQNACFEANLAKLCKSQHTLLVQNSGDPIYRNFNPKAPPRVTPDFMLQTTPNQLQTSPPSPAASVAIDRRAAPLWRLRTCRRRRRPCLSVASNVARCLSGSCVCCVLWRLVGATMYEAGPIWSRCSYGSHAQPSLPEEKFSRSVSL